MHAFPAPSRQYSPWKGTARSYRGPCLSVDPVVQILRPTAGENTKKSDVGSAVVVGFLRVQNLARERFSHLWTGHLRMCLSTRQDRPSRRKCIVSHNSPFPSCADVLRSSVMPSWDDTCREHLSIWAWPQSRLIVTGSPFSAIPWFCGVHFACRC